MVEKSKWLLFCLLVFMLLASAAACSSNPTTEESVETDDQTEESITEETAEGIELTIGIEAEPTSLDPFNTTDGNSATVQSTMFEGLLRFDENMELVPVLARDYTYNEDATEITFTLQEGVTFHDGTAFNAEVVKENLDFVRDRDNGLARASFFSFISEVVVNDEFSVTIKSEEPNSAMASYMAHASASFKSIDEIAKKKEDENYNLDRNPVGTGPFVFDEWRDSEHVVVRKFEEYWNSSEAARVESITFRPVVEASTRVNMLKTGEVDLIYPIPTLNAAELENDADIDLYVGSSTDVFYIGMNFKEDKYQDLKVRQAMNHAVDKDGLIAQILDGYGQIAASAIAPAVYGYSGQSIYEHDKDLARELMAEAGMEDGFKATLWTRNTTEFVSVAEYVAIQLSEIGIDVEVQAYESGTLFDMLDAGENTDLWIGRWSPGTGEADYGLRPNFASDRVPPNFNNSGYYINEELDQLFDEALRTPDQEKALSVYADLQKKIYEDAPWVFLHIPDTIIAKGKNVTGIYVLPSGAVHLNQADKK
ncbi:glutathione ABC transporter substrate-binding protein [Alkalihalobacterium chitinilyticum]|uniref:Glutathione ABC transporter substrate-binding protein n=1 Tax=Alkalihalobacterium chitinilyticum TaxID=2980103 RepID=A0ABT5VLU6_9BACI|nr:glutathione ABC transporter substrate-binding protein [Alkalihalobacterium chitinilyticum]MDE5415244.1 glutathione ABC transporter substrate-binding protein [Alkalihalobacterium chitinilyticum]